jgi:DNA polymerase III alpha subunit
MIVEAGIVSSLIERSTKKGKRFYWVNILTPYEEIRITVWNEQFNKYNRFFQVGRMIWVSGEKGYGGMSLTKIGDATDFAYKK